MNICSNEKCSKKHYARGLCLIHYYREYRLYHKRDYSKNLRKCTMLHCGKAHHAHGLCHSHYLMDSGKICSVSNCNNTVRAKGLCITHYNNKNIPYRANCKSKECAICGYSNVIHRHHIIPKSKGGNDESNNLIALCPNHHWEVHNNLLKIPQRTT